MASKCATSSTTACAHLLCRASNAIRWSSRRTVPTTVCPASNAASAKARPKPAPAPVIRKLFFFAFLMASTSISRPGAVVFAVGAGDSLLVGGLLCAAKCGIDSDGTQVIQIIADDFQGYPDEHFQQCDLVEAGRHKSLPGLGCNKSAFRHELTGQCHQRIQPRVSQGVPVPNGLDVFGIDPQALQLGSMGGNAIAATILDRGGEKDQLPLLGSERGLLPRRIQPHIAVQ